MLVHCNSYVGGFWTDITRTYCLGEPSQAQAEMYAAVLAASAAAIATIRPGVYGHEVDRAARDVLTQRGFGDGFKHSTGHGVGFAAIDHHAPRVFIRNRTIASKQAWSSTSSQPFMCRATEEFVTATWLLSPNWVPMSSLRSKRTSKS